jgi:hypothetical protein
VASLTGDVIVDRIRSLCIAAPFGLVESPGWDSFDRMPTTTIDGAFRVVSASQGVRGKTGYVEERNDSVQVWVARKHNGDFDDVRRTMLGSVHSLTAAIVRDGAITSGEYVVLDEGRGHAIVSDPSKEYVQLRLTVSVNYESQL